jgi:carotenoid cleavage dioxygenase-like enzyme
VLDARAPAGGPIGRAYFDQIIPFGAHGMWAPAS